MKLITLLFCLLLFSCSTTSSKKGFKEVTTPIDSIYRDAVQFHKNDSVQEALMHYKKVTKASNEYLWAQYGLHQCLYFTGDVDSAVNGMMKLSKLPTDTTGYTTINYIYYKSNHFLAMHYYEEAIEHKDPERLRESYEYVKRAIAIYAPVELKLLIQHLYIVTRNYDKMLETKVFHHKLTTKEFNEFMLLQMYAELQTEKISSKRSFKQDSYENYKLYPDYVIRNMRGIEKKFLQQYHIKMMKKKALERALERELKRKPPVLKY